VTRADFPGLFTALLQYGFKIIGPTVREGAIIYDEIAAVGDLPVGLTDEQEAGTYRLARRGDSALFGYNVGPQSWKQYLHPSRLLLWQAVKRDGQLSIQTEISNRPPRMAFVGVRACELHAIGIQDRVFLQGTFVDRHYQERRDQVCIIAVSCGQAGNTCFCTSMGTGPRVEAGEVDLSLVELLDASRHDFLFQAGSKLGTDLLERVPHRPATEEDLRQAESILATTAASMGREMKTEGLVDLLKSRPDHPRWGEVATRCLTCTNCTMVCPTCFCTSVQDTTDLMGQTAERWRNWDSCFTLDFSHVVGGSIRTSTMSRYRQWMTHKLATWVDQFGTSGCVGCGRCITWCPVGIDITEEVAAIQASPQVGLPAVASSGAPGASTSTSGRKRKTKEEEPGHE
jgi:Fe-S-cluster-containing hydrogenase component 2